jgi:hypothetical protein
MYQIIEYRDFFKQRSIRVTGFCYDKNKAIETAKQLVNNRINNLQTIIELEKDEKYIIRYSVCNLNSSNDDSNLIVAVLEVN